MDNQDIPEILEHYWQQLGLTFDPAESADAANTITRITGGTLFGRAVFAGAGY